MITRIEVPFIPRPNIPRGTHLEPPQVPIESRWEYKELVRHTEVLQLPTEAELNALGVDGWELAGIATAGQQVHFYFKRERTR